MQKTAVLYVFQDFLPEFGYFDHFHINSCLPTTEMSTQENMNSIMI
jgi:hypothetical protein